MSLSLSSGSITTAIRKLNHLYHTGRIGRERYCIAIRKITERVMEGNYAKP